MRKILKKGAIVWLLFFIMIECIGCKKKGDMKEEVLDPSIPAWQQHTEDKVTFDWYVNFSWFNTVWGENMVSKKITEDTGIDINFISPIGNEAEKFNSLITSDNLPDIITLGWWEPQVDEMINKDMVYALNELADEYDPYFFKVTNRQVCDWYTQEDGNLYCYPNSYYLPKDYEENDNIGSAQTFLVRKDMYEAIGSPDMTTLEGFKAAVKKAAIMYPEVNGYPMMPIGAHAFTDNGCNSFDQFLMNFLAIPFEKDGKFYDRYTDPEYIGWLKTFRELCQEGYIKDDIFIDQRTQMEEKLMQGRYFCMLYQRTDIEAQQKQLYANDPNSIYIAVDGPKNSCGDDPVLPGAGINGWTVTLISKNCERPERAIELFTYFISEYGQKMIYLGVQGGTYDVVDGKPKLKEGVLQLLNNNRAEYDKLYGASDTYWMFQNNAMQSKWNPNAYDPLGQLEKWTYPYTHYLGQYDFNFEVDSDVGNADIKIKKLWGETLPHLLLASSEDEFDQIYAEFIQKREKLGFGLVMNESTRQMNHIKSKLGLE